MPPKVDRRTAHALAIMVALLVTAGCSPNPPATSKSPSSALVGAWRSKLQFTSGAFAPIRDLEFLYVFHAGGTMTESSNYDGAPPVPPAYGVWRQTAPNEFEAKYLFYATKAPSRFEDISGGGGWLPAGHGVFVERIHLADGAKSFTSEITYEAFDTAGMHIAGGGQAKGQGQRIEF